jgi:Superinfection immunity protein
MIVSVTLDTELTIALARILLDNPLNPDRMSTLLVPIMATGPHVDVHPLGLAIFFIFAAIAFALYFLPFIIAASRRHPQSAPIFIINFFFGWTFIGWVVALAWSVSTIR